MAKSLQDASALPRHHRPKHTRGTSSVHNVKSGGSPAPCHSPQSLGITWDRRTYGRWAHLGLWATSGWSSAPPPLPRADPAADTPGQRALEVRLSRLSHRKVTLKAKKHRSLGTGCSVCVFTRSGSL